jgi:hypothetical protein
MSSQLAIASELQDLPQRPWVGPPAAELTPMVCLQPMRFRTGQSGRVGTIWLRRRGAMFALDSSWIASSS